MFAACSLLVSTMIDVGTVDSIRESQRFRRMSGRLCEKESTAALKVSGRLFERESTAVLKVSGQLFER